MEIKFGPDRLIVVTGGSSGIGESIVTALLDSGASVAVLSRNATKSPLAELCGDPAKKLFLYNCDISSYEQVKSVFHEIDNTAGPIYGLINNAGINPSRNTVTETSVEDWERTISVNLSGAFYCSQFAINSMRKEGRGGVIIMISSIAGICAMEKRASYSVSKTGLIGLMRSIAADYAKEKIRAVSICPGYVPTKLTIPYFNALKKEEYGELLEKHRLGKLGEPSDIAGISLFLLSDYAGWITGVEIPVDGGYSV